MDFLLEERLVHEFGDKDILDPEDLKQRENYILEYKKEIKFKKIQDVRLQGVLKDILAFEEDDRPSWLELKERCAETHLILELEREK